MTKNGENDPRMMVGFFIGFGWNCEKKKKKTNGAGTFCKNYISGEIIVS